MARLQESVREEIIQRQSYFNMLDGGVGKILLNGGQIVTTDIRGVRSTQKKSPPFCKRKTNESRTNSSTLRIPLTRKFLWSNNHALYKKGNSTKLLDKGLYNVMYLSDDRSVG